MRATLYKNFRWGLTGESQALRVEDGRVTERGPNVSGLGAEEIDLGGRFLLPALTDCHCHILSTGLDLAKLHLGAANTQVEVLDAVRDRHRDTAAGWLLAVHYDQNKWGGEHLTRTQLDTISATRPILLRHVNGHASVANSAALVAAGIAPDESDPSDGSFGREASGVINGVLFEGVHERVSSASPAPSFDEAVAAIAAAAQSMAAFGIEAATDMQTNVKDLAAYQAAAERNCPIRFKLYLVWKDVFGPRAVDRELVEVLREGRDSRLAVAGVKLFADGAIGSATAAVYGGYADRPLAPGDYAGQLMYSAERLQERVRVAHEAGFRVATHAIGDHALNIVLDAYEATGDAARHRVEHAMLLSDAQIERLADSGVSVAMQPEFLIRFGHTYRTQLGAERASHLKRFRSVLHAGIPLAFSSDRPICAGSPWTGIECACDRPEGFDPAENLTRVEAIERYLEPAATIGGGEPAGSLSVGQASAAIVMESDPLLAGTPRNLTFLQEL
ncbi:MAG: amidohydrolase [Fimbriimonadaceae bacterium]